MELIDIVEIIIKLVLGLSILNVWLVNRNKLTPWRGGNANSMQEEFAAYGLSKNMMIIVGTLKCLFAVLLLISIIFSALIVDNGTKIPLFKWASSYSLCSLTSTIKAPFSIDLTASSTLNDLKPINDGLSFQ